MSKSLQTKKIGVYVRVSSDNQLSDEGSLKSQRQRLEMEVERRNYGKTSWGKIVNTYVEEARSAKDTNRPEFLRMLQDVKSGIIDTIMVTELSRLSRSVADFLQIMTFLEKYEADFVCPQYNFDTTSPSGRVFLTIIIALAQFEREMTSERVKNNLKARSQRGLFNGGFVPLGYKIDPAKKGYLFVDENEAPIVVEIFNTVLEVGSVRQSVKEIRSKGIQTKKIVYEDGRIVGGVPFTRDTLIAMLRNYAYLGKVEVNRDNRDIPPDELQDRDRYQVIDAVWPGIIDADVFDRVQKLIQHNRTRLRGSIAKTYPYILSGIVRCQYCGENFAGMSANGRNKKYFYYSHKSTCEQSGLHRIDAPSLEKFVLKRLEKIANDKELLGLLVDAANKQNIGSMAQNESLLRAKRSDLSEVEKSANELIDRMLLLPKELLDSSFIQRKLADLEERKKSLESAIEQLSADCNRSKDSIVILDEIRKTLNKVLKKFRSLSIPLQRDLIRQVIKEIILTPTQIKLVIYGKGDFDERDYQDDQSLLTTGSYVGGNGS